MKIKTMLFVAALVATSNSFAIDKKTEQALEHRQSSMKLVVQNFGPMGAMLKGKIDWDQEMLKSLAHDLSAIASTNLMRGYAPNTSGGKTKAKPGIWDNLSDFEAKMDTFKTEASLLKTAAAGSKADFGKQFKKVANTCKSCHQDYKSKEYLN